MGLKAGDLSLLAGMATGEGLTGKLMRQGFGGMIPSYIAKNAYEEEQERKKAEAGGVAPPSAPAMKKGGKVSSASKRADGCAQRGKTKGRMV